MDINNNKFDLKELYKEFKNNPKVWKEIREETIKFYHEIQQLQIEKEKIEKDFIDTKNKIYDDYKNQGGYN